MILDKSVKITIGSKNLSHFRNLNYKCNVKDIIDIKPEHLMNNSKILINAKCDVCGNKTVLEYRSYIKNTSKYPIYCCNTSCAKTKENQTKKEKYGDNYENIRVANMKKTNKERYGNENPSQIFRNEKKHSVFINQLKEIYKKEKFDYSKVNYINNYTPVEIICEKHGTFKSRPNELLIGQGCIKCNKEKLNEKKLEKYLKKCNKIHNNKYDYSKVIFKNKSSKVTIICPIHGEFEQVFNYHYYGCGCQKCAKISMRIKRIESINNNFKNGHQITPNFNKTACKIFDEISKKENINIQHAMNGGEYCIKELGYWIDGYDVDNNVVYEFDEPKHFSNDILKEKDIIRQKEIEKILKCKFIRIKD